MILIAVTLSDGRKIYLNMEKVISIWENGGKTELDFGDENVFHIKESNDVLLSCIRQAGCKNIYE